MVQNWLKSSLKEQSYFNFKYQHFVAARMHSFHNRRGIRPLLEGMIFYKCIVHYTKKEVTEAYK